MLVNVVDVPPLCNFILPAIVRTGPLAIAISTAGASPALAKRIKRQIADEFGEPYARLAVLLNEVRGWAKGTLPDLPGPQGVLRGHRQRRPDPIELLRAGDEAAVRDLIAAAQHAARDAAPPRRDRPRRRPPRGRAPRRRRRTARRVDHLAHARRAHRRHGRPQAREPAARRRLQVPRRVQRGRLAAAAERDRGVVTASSGNHAQALALAAALHGARRRSSCRGRAASKAAATEGYGARIVRFDRYADDREALLAAWRERDGADRSSTPTTTSASWPARARPRSS
jgi:hypothetical protein